MTATPVLSVTATQGTDRSRRRTLIALFPPTDPTMAGGGALVVFLVAWAAAVVRLGRDVGAGSIWAEDGTIFWSQERSGGLSELLLAPYAGYAHVAPRLLIWIIDRMPVTDAAIGVAVLAAAVQAGSAWTAYVVVRAHLRRAVPALMVAGAVAVIPVGPEVVLNLANVQWFLLFAGVFVQMWVPRGWLGWASQLVLGMALALSSPFGLLGAAAAVLRAAVVRGCRSVVSAVLLVAAAATQAVVMAGAGSTRLKPDPSVDSIGGGYLRRVIADGILGVGRNVPGEQSSSVLVGAAFLAGFVVLLVIAARRQGSARVVPVLGVLGLSVVAYAGPVVITGLNTANPHQGGRYYVAPALLWLVALVMVLPQASAEGRGAWAWASWLVTGALVVALGVGMWTSYRTPRVYRVGAPGWVAQLELARQRCAELGPDSTVDVAIAPQGWGVTSPCRLIVGDPS